MKRFLKLHFNMIDDLRRAEMNAEKAGLGVTAGHLKWYADELENYKPERRYLCDVSRHSWSMLKAWQKKVITIADQYNQCVFNRQEIEHLAERLNKYAHEQKFCTEDVTGPKFEDEEKYGIRPTIRIGTNCAIGFTPIRGDYEY